MGAIFLPKSRFWIDFRVPGETLGEPLGRILGRKIRVEKKVEKKVVRVVASAGNADPGKEGF